MSNQKILRYVEDVMSEIEAPESFKRSLENELLRQVIEAAERLSLEEVKNNLGSPEELAAKLAKMPGRVCEKPDRMRDCHRHTPRKSGEFTREESRVNIKLLYIPLIQISSGTERTHIYWTDED